MDGFIKILASLRDLRGVCEPKEFLSSGFVKAVCVRLLISESPIFCVIIRFVNQEINIIYFCDGGIWLY